MAWVGNRRVSELSALQSEVSARNSGGDGLRDGEPAVVEVRVEPVEPDIRDLYLPSELGNTVAFLGYGAPGGGPELIPGAPPHTPASRSYLAPAIGTSGW